MRLHIPKRLLKTKKSSIFIFFLVLCLVAIAASIGLLYRYQLIRNQFTDKNPGNYVASYYEGNYVWAGAMNLAWNELVSSILHEPVMLRTTDPAALKIVSKLNSPAMTSNDLDEESYYIKSGFGQSTVNAINEESRRKFPNKQVSNLSTDLSDDDFISYAYFLKEVEYPHEFEQTSGSFLNTRVKGFTFNNKKSQSNVEIVEYWDSDKLILSLRLKNNKDQLFLAKGFDMKDPSEVLREISQQPRKAYLEMSEDDRLFIPNIHLKHKREYTELINVPFANSDFTRYVIREMFENISFDMDHRGARVENEAVIVGARTVSISKPERFLLLDKPYWIVMKRTHSSNPYFLLGVSNHTIMEKASIR